MKKNSIYVFIVAIGLILSACGSNSKPDGTSNDDTGTITTALQSITVDKNSGNIAADVRVTSTYANSVVATLNSMDISLGGCSLVAGSVSANPDTITLDSTTPSKDVVLTGTLADPLCVPTSYQITGTNTLAVDGQTATRSFTTERADINASSIVDSTLKNILSIVDPANKTLDINESNITKPIIIHLSLGNTALINERVKINSSVTAGSFFTSAVVTDDLGNATFAYTSPDTITNNRFDVKFCMESDDTVCDTATINLTTGTVTPPDNNETPPDTGNDFVNYGIVFKAEDGKNTLGLDDRKAFIVSLIDKDTNEPIDSNKLKKITIESNKPDVLKLIDPSDAVGAAVDKLEIENKNNIKIYLKASKEISGLSDIKVKIEYTNNKGYSRELIKTYAITVFSGPPTAFSINSAGVSYNFDTKWFENKFLISASDKYNNPINTSPTISVSVMAGYAKDSNGNRIVYGQYSKNNLGISGDTIVDGNKVILGSNGVSPFVEFDTNSLRGVDLDRDVVAIFGNVRTYEVNGKWEIDDITDASHLNLKDIYAGNEYKGIGFAVGHNYREDYCDGAYPEWQVKVDSTDGSYQLDEEGKTFVTVKFPAEFMVGKKVALMVNFIGQNPETGKQLRAGEVKFKTLRSFEGILGRTVTIAKGATQTVRLWGVVDTGTKDTWSLHNSLFSCSTVDSKNIEVLSISKNDPNSCVQPYVEYVVKTVNSDEEGTFILSDCQVNEEFIF